MRRSMLAVALAMPPWTAHAQERAPPAPHCLDARQLDEIHQPSPRTLAIEGGDGRRYRLDLDRDCPVAAASRATLLAREGWVCGTGREFVRTDDRLCAVTGARVIDARDYAVLARAAMVADRGVKTLETVEVKAPKWKGFAGSPSFCFNPRYLRAWSEDPRSLIVELSPRHPGGHRRYRVELGDRCPQLDGAPAISFRSGVGIGLICGNAGDQVLAHMDDRANMFEADDPMREDWRPSSAYALRRPGLPMRCGVSAVYPMDAAR